ncbi:MAG: dihydrofolate reductase family protein [Candidatus Dormiibacterota bacterium]
MEPLQLLYQVAGEPAWPLPSELSSRYGGELGFRPPVLFGNFVSSLDGVVNMPGERSVGRTLSGNSPADRFVMGLLRACADAVLLGAGTLRASPRSTWTAQEACPELAAAFTALRTRLALPPRPRLVVLTGAGDLDPDHPGLAGSPLVVTGERGAGRLPSALAPHALVLAHGSDPVDPVQLWAAIRGEGLRTVLSEAGPEVTGQLLAGKVLDELFLTLSPLIAGRPEDEPRPGLAEGVRLLPGDAATGHLASVRRYGDHLFVRYRLHSTSAVGP